MPFGFFFAIVLQKSDWRKTVIIGLVFSFVMEITQVLADRGLGELDDVLHNTWGGLAEYCVAVILGYLFGRHSNRYKGKVRGASLFFGITILAFAMLIFYDQSDWNVHL